MDKSSITTEEYQFIANLLMQATGMELGENKHYLLESRLKEIWESLQLGSVRELIHYLRTHTDPKIVKLVGEKMTTNETLFFRDQVPYDFFRNVILPEAHRRSQGKELKIWSAACSTGQEPYSIAISLAEERHRFPFTKIDILATDIAQSVLEKAQAGVFSKYELSRGMPTALGEKYFLAKGADFEVKPELKKNIRFKERNLIQFRQNEIFDCIFLRNVLIYFDVETKRKIIENAFQMLHPKGYIFLGAAETMMGVSEKFQRVEKVTISVYKKI
jgi:chemotaxis protein methyltransferase CheR